MFPGPVYYLIGPGLWTEILVTYTASSMRIIPHHIYKQQALRHAHDLHENNAKITLQ